MSSGETRRENFQMTTSSTYRTPLLPVNLLFFSFFTSVAAFGVVIAATSMVAWRVEIPLGDINNAAIFYGLFQVCTKRAELGVIELVRCFTSQEFAQTGSILGSENNDLEQATKAMAILSIFLLLISSTVSFILGLTKFERDRGVLIVTLTHLVSGVSVMSGVITYTLLLENLQEITPKGTFLLPQLSYYLLCVAMALAFSSSIISFIGGMIQRRVK